MTARKKRSVIVVYTGDGKGKTTAGIGLLCRSLGHGGRVAFIQFIKSRQVSEDTFLQSITPHMNGRLVVYKGGRGFYNAGQMSAAGVSKADHTAIARQTFDVALDCVKSGRYDLVICDEINNAVHDDLLLEGDLANIIANKHSMTNLCLTGRNFPKTLYAAADIITNMTAVHHHYNEGFIANEGIDY